MREEGGGRTRSYWISFILSLVSLWIVFVYSLLGPGIPLPESMHILRAMLHSQSITHSGTGIPGLPGESTQCTYSGIDLWGPKEMNNHKYV